MSEQRLDMIEVRLLGSTRVRRVDGSWIESGEWRTRKTLELLRMLALHEGKRVSTDTLVEALWPGSDAEHAKTSLRTAASQIRKAVGLDCIARSHGGLHLEHAWVDIQRFKALVDECSRASAEGRHTDAVAAARDAEALYVEDLVISADSDDSTVMAHEALRRARGQLLLDAATSAMALHWTYDAATFAADALALDPGSERAGRMAMLAFQAVGETKRALTVYQECRARLVDELGVDPSPQTQAVYLQLLRAPTAPELTPSFTGLGTETHQLATQLSTAAGEGGSCVVVAGPPRSGVSRWLNEAVRRLPEQLHRPVVTNGASHHGDAPLVEGKALSRGITIVDPETPWSVQRLERTIESMRRSANSATAVVVVTYRTGVDVENDARLGELTDEGTVRRVDIPPLSDDELLALTRSLVSGEPARELLDELDRSTGRYAGLVVDTVAGWLAQGRLRHSDEGVQLGPDPDLASEHKADREQLSELHASLSGKELTVLEALAAVASITMMGLLTLLGHDEGQTDAARAELALVLTRLEEFALLAVDESGRYLLASQRLRDALSAWTRPGRRRYLHRTAAERLTLPVAARVRHWTLAGETELACAAALEGAEAAMNDSMFAEARQLLLQVLELLDDETSTPEDRFGIVCRLAVCAGQLGLEHEAEQHVRESQQLAADHGLALPDPVKPLPLLPEPDIAMFDPQHHPESFGILPSTSPTPEVEVLLTDAIRAAEFTGDLDRAAEARILLVGHVLAPRRQFAQARLALNLAKAASTNHRPMIELTEVEAPILLGDPTIELGSLARHSGDADVRYGLTSGLPVGMLEALAYHDRAHPKAESICEKAIVEAERVQPGGPWRWVAARILVQRGEVDRAHALTEGCAWRTGAPTARILSLLGKAELALALGEQPEAANDLLRSVEIAQRTGATLLLPEVAARLVMAGDQEDPESTMEYLDLAEVALGESTGGRERITIMLARAAVRALTGRPLSAAVVAGGAAELASSLGLHYAAIEAADLRSTYLRQAGPAAAAGGE